MKHSYSLKGALAPFLVTVISLVLIYLGNQYFNPEIFDDQSTSFYRAKVVKINAVEEGEDGQITGQAVQFTAQILEGESAGNYVMATQQIGGSHAYQSRAVEAGDRVIMGLSRNSLDGSATWIFAEHNKLPMQLLLLAIFFVLIILFGRSKGVSTILALVITALAIFGVFIPAILAGYNIYLITVIITIFIIITSLVLISGFSLKTLCAIVGNVGGVVITGGLAILFNRLLLVTGVVDEQYVFLKFVNPEAPIDLQAVIWAGIMIGALGAVMDVAMSIASSMNELAETMREKSYRSMLRSGMNIGRDAIGTMTNTLILAYIGSSLAMVLLLVAYNKDLLYLFNLELIVVDVMQALVGSIGILLAVPATAIFSAYMFNRPAKPTPLKR